MAHFTITVCVLLCFSVVLCNTTCIQIVENGVSEEDKRTIVNYHNYLRAVISQGSVPGQPKPKKRLNDLIWDPLLAAQAQNIANMCEFNHVEVLDRRFDVGQNLGWGQSTAPTAPYAKKGGDWVKTITGWFNEHKDFIYPNRSKGVTGHYTQLVWADTKYIGCGYTMNHNKGQYFGYETFYVCLYGPGGNFFARPPYV